MNRTNEYRAKGYEILSLAETVNDPERRADMLRYAICPNVDEFIGTDVRSADRLRVAQVPALGRWSIGPGNIALHKK